MLKKQIQTATDFTRRFEFKFVVLMHGHPEQAKWENNPNHVFDLPDYIEQFSKTETLDYLTQGASGGVANLKFPDNKDVVSYDINKRVLLLLAPWR